MNFKIAKSESRVLEYISYDEESHYFADIDFKNPNWYEDSLVCKLTGEYGGAHIYIHMLMLVFRDEKKVEEYVKEKSKEYNTEIDDEAEDDGEYCNDCGVLLYSETKRILSVGCCQYDYCINCYNCNTQEDNTDEEDDA
jgi:hypothetical protein